MNAKLIGRNLNNRRFWRTSGLKMRGSYRFHWTAKWCRIFGDSTDYNTVYFLDGLPIPLIVVPLED